VAFRSTFCSSFCTLLLLPTFLSFLIPQLQFKMIFHETFYCYTNFIRFRLPKTYSIVSSMESKEYNKEKKSQSHSM
jgi:hypothetical protein